MMPNIDGRVAWKFEESNYDIDNILGPAYITLRDPALLHKYCMAGYESGFADKVRDGDVIIGGENYGYGHTHFTPFIAMRQFGIKAVLAESFFPDFYKAETTFGFLLLEVPGIIEITKRWDNIRVDWGLGKVIINDRTEIPFVKPPQRTIDLVECGGIINYLKEKRQ